MVQHYVIKFVSDLRQVGGFFRVSFTNKTDRHDIAETLLKVVLNTIKQTKVKESTECIVSRYIFYYKVRKITDM